MKSLNSNGIEALMDLAQQIVFLVFVVAYTLAAVYWDRRYWKIPNKLTIPMFFAGWIYQGAFNGLAGLGDGALGFLAGFGTLFLLWIIGSAGGGDVKLLGGLSVWLGLYWTIYVFVVSTVLVILLTIAYLIWNVVTKGTKATKKRLLATGKPGKPGGKPKTETVAEKQSRRIEAYALPIALATWGLLILGFVADKPTLPWNM